MDAYTYTDITEKTTVPTAEWKKTVEDHLVKHGVVWVNPRYVKAPTESNVEETSEEGPDNDYLCPIILRTLKMLGHKDVPNNLIIH